MIKQYFFNRCLTNYRHLFLAFQLLLCTAIALPEKVYAHQTPTTIVLLDISPDRVSMELQLPLSELELAFGKNLSQNPETILQRYRSQLEEYLKAHIHPFISKEKPWLVEIESMRLEKGIQPGTEQPFWEIIFDLVLKPNSDESARKFILDYDVIMHQVINHTAFVSVRNDWGTGNINNKTTEIGVIQWNTRDNAIYPLEVNLEQGNWWKGFGSMVMLGMQHIKEGTDHLLFIIVLLLPCMLILEKKHWGKYGGIKYSLWQILRIVTAFTIGHSLTLLIGALGWIKLPSQPVEILIAFSILVSAVHAVYPVFSGKEKYIAIGFGLIHGLAFSSVLAQLNTGMATLIASILGFNIGIELMQLGIIALILPWLMLMSRTGYYKWVRLGVALFASLAALGWISERMSGEQNYITAVMEKVF